MTGMDESRPNTSLWIATTPATDYPALKGDITVDVAVVGGGITGLTVAALLKEAGARAAVVERRRIATGTTGHTTAKLTSLHSLIYRYLIDTFGEEKARMYADANQRAIGMVREQAERLGIDCNYQYMPAYSFTGDEQRVADIDAEVEAARSLGLPVERTGPVALPVSSLAAVRFDSQALFHPRKYCLGLASFIDGGGSRIFEESGVLSIEGEGPCTVQTANGRVMADWAIIATLLPFGQQGFFYARTKPSRSYALAARVENPSPDGMYLSVDTPTRSVRPYPPGAGTVLVIEGESQRPGEHRDTQQEYDILERWTRQHFQVQEIEYQWSAQDYMPLDRVPYVGKVSPGTDRVLVATGFKKWGMSNGTAAAMMLADTVLGKQSPWFPVFDSDRLDIKASAASFVKDNATVVKDFVAGHMEGRPAVTDLKPGEGRVIEVNEERIAAYRDPAGQIKAVSATCTHMGCIVGFNDAERTWDCPCHGSRFTLDGEVIEGPAVYPLEKKAL